MPSINEVLFFEQLKEQAGSFFTDGQQRLSPDEIAEARTNGASDQDLIFAEAARRQPVQPWEKIKNQPEFETLSREEKTQLGYQYLRDVWFSTPHRERTEDFHRFFDAWAEDFEKSEIRPMQRRDWAFPAHVRNAWRSQRFATEWGNLEELSAQRVELEQQLRDAKRLPPETLIERKERVDNWLTRGMHAPVDASRKVPAKDRVTELETQLAELDAKSGELGSFVARMQEEIAREDVNKGYELLQGASGWMEFAQYASPQDYIGAMTGMLIESAPAMAQTMAAGAAGGVAGSSTGPVGTALMASSSVGLAAYSVEFSHRFPAEFFGHLSETNPGWMDDPERGRLIVELASNREKMEEFRKTAEAEAGAIAGAEAVTSLLTYGMAYKMLNKAGAWNKTVAFGANQFGAMAGGSGGEFLAHLAGGKDPFSGRAMIDITMEGVLEFAGAPVELGIAGAQLGWRKRAEMQANRRMAAASTAKKAEAAQAWDADTLSEMGVPREQALAVMEEKDMAKRWDAIDAALATVEAEEIANQPQIEQVSAEEIHVLYPDGTRSVHGSMDTAGDAVKAWAGQAQPDRLAEIRKAREIAEETRELAEFWEGQGEGREAQFRDKFTSLQQLVDEKVAAGQSQEEATAAAVEQMRGAFVRELETLGLPTEQAQAEAGKLDAEALAQTRVFGRNWSEVEQGMNRRIMEMSLGASPVEVAHEAAESYIKDAWEREAYTVDEVLGWVNQWRKYRGETEIDAANMSESAKADAAREGFAGLYEAYIAGHFQRMNLPQKVVQFFRNLARYMRELLDRAAGLKKAFSEGALDPQLKTALGEVLGLTPNQMDQAESLATGQEVEAFAEIPIDPEAIEALEEQAKAEIYNDAYRAAKEEGRSDKSARIRAEVAVEMAFPEAQGRGKIRRTLNGMELAQRDRILNITDQEERREFIESNDVPMEVLEEVVRMDAADTAANAELEWRLRQDEQAQAQEGQAEGIDLDEAIKKLGGLMTPKVAREKGDPLAGEFETAQKESGRKVIGRWKNKGMPYDEAITALNDLGFDFTTPEDLANAILAHDRGETVRANPPTVNQWSSESYALGIDWNSRLAQAVLNRRLNQLHADLARRDYAAIREKDDRSALIRDLREFQAIASLLPTEVRAKLGGLIALSKIRNVEGRRQYLHNRLEKAAGLMEQYLRKEGLKEIDKILEKASPGKKSGRDTGNLGGKGHEMFGEAQRLINLTEEEYQIESQEIIGALEKVSDAEAHQNIVEKFALLNMLGALRKRGSSDIGAAIPFLQDLFSDFRLRRKELLAKRKEQIEAHRLELRDANGNPNPTPNQVQAGRRKHKNPLKSVDNYATMVLNVADLLEHLFPGSELAKQWGQAVKDQANQTTDQLLLHEKQFRDFARRVFDLNTGFRQDNALNNRLAEMAKPQKETGVFYYGPGQTKEVAMMDAKAIAEGFADPAYSSEERAAIKEAYDQHIAEIRERVKSSAKKAKESKIDIETAKRIHAGEDVGNYTDEQRLAISDAYEEHVKEGERRKAAGEKRPISDWNRRKKLSYAPVDTSAVGRESRRKSLKVFMPGAIEEAELSEFEAMQDLMTLMQPDYAERAAQLGFPPEARQQLEAFLSDEAKEIMAYMQDVYAKMWDRVNPIYERIHGINLQRLPFYAPGKFESADATHEMDPLGGEHQIQGIHPGGLKARVPHNAQRARVSAFNVFFAHLHEMEHYVSFAELARDMRAVLSDKKVQDTVIAAHGAVKNDHLQKWLKIIEGGGHVASEAKLYDAKLARALMERIAAAGISFNPGTYILQFGNTLASLEEVSTKEWFLSAMKLRNETSLRERLGRIWNSPIIRRRIGAGASPELQMMMGPDPKKATVLGGLPRVSFAALSATDAGFLTLSLAIAYDVKFREAITRNPQISETEAHAFALREVEIIAGKVQQSVSWAEKSLFENTRGPWTKLGFTMFISDGRRKLASVYMDWLRATQGTGTYKQAVKRSLMLWAAIPVLDYVFRGLAAAIFKGEDPEDAFDPRKMYAAILSGQSNGIPVVGPLIDMAIRSKFGLPVWSSHPVVGAGQSVVYSTEDLADAANSLTAGDWATFGEEMVSAAKGSAYVHPAWGSIANLIFYGAGFTKNATDGDTLNDVSEALTTFGGGFWLDAEERAMMELEGGLFGIGSASSRQSAERAKETRILDNLANKAARLEGAEQAEFLQGIDPETRRRVESRIDGAEMSKLDKLIDSYGVENGMRAAKIAQYLRALPDAERWERIEHWRKLGILSAKVERQLADLGVQTR